LIAGSSPVVRAGLEALVRTSDDLQLSGVVATDRLGSSLEGTTADVLLMEVPLLNEDWISTVSGFSVATVVLTEISEAVPLAAAFRGGIRGVLSVDASPGEIVAAISSAAAGLVTLQPWVVDHLAVDARPASPLALDDPLSPRETRVLNMLAEGLSNKIIAHQLGISEHTVKYHVASILSKLGAGSRTDAVMQGIRRGIVMI
jgi:DNA-binding NarL/FixJ family response regulator